MRLLGLDPTLLQPPALPAPGPPTTQLQLRRKERAVRSWERGETWARDALLGWRSAPPRTGLRVQQRQRLQQALDAASLGAAGRLMGRPAPEAFLLAGESVDRFSERAEDGDVFWMAVLDYLHRWRAAWPPELFQRYDAAITDAVEAVHLARRQARRAKKAEAPAATSEVTAPVVSSRWDGRMAGKPRRGNPLRHYAEQKKRSVRSAIVRLLWDAKLFNELQRPRAGWPAPELVSLNRDGSDVEGWGAARRLRVGLTNEAERLVRGTRGRALIVEVWSVMREGLVTQLVFPVEGDGTLMPPYITVEAGRQVPPRVDEAGAATWLAAQRRDYGWGAVGMARTHRIEVAAARVVRELMAGGGVSEARMRLWGTPGDALIERARRKHPSLANLDSAGVLRVAEAVRAWAAETEVGRTHELTLAAAVHRAAHTYVGADARWSTLRETRPSRQAVREALAAAFGISGGSSFGGGWVEYRGGRKPQVSWRGAVGAEVSVRGLELVRLARMALDLPAPEAR